MSEIRREPHIAEANNRRLQGQPPLRCFAWKMRLQTLAGPHRRGCEKADWCWVAGESYPAVTGWAAELAAFRRGCGRAGWCWAGGESYLAETGWAAEPAAFQRGLPAVAAGGVGA